jgi:putative acetyltransferase
VIFVLEGEVTVTEAISIRPEAPADEPAVEQVHELAFGRADEGRLVAALRRAGAVTLALVAEQSGSVVGHILFSPVTIERGNDLTIAVGLAPLAVRPAFQHQGVGSALVRRGLDELRAAGHAAVVVLGHAHYYPRFGFVPARGFDLRGEPGWSDASFMAIELRPGALAGPPGRVRYRPELTPVTDARRRDPGTRSS